jgi:hypothetical protein
MAFQSFRAYWGRGQEGTGEPIHPGTIAKLAHIFATEVHEERRMGNWHMGKQCQIGFLVEGHEWKVWLSDMYYYSANNHPLHGIFACDTNNRLEWEDRLMMELATFSYCFWMAFEKDDLVPHPFENEFYYRLVMVTFGSIAIYYALFFMFTTPWAMIDESLSSEDKVKKAKQTSHAGDILGGCCVFTLIGTAVWRIANLDQSNNSLLSIAEIVFHSRIMSYFISWFLTITVYFNPFMAWGATDPEKSSIGDWIGLGQWVVEKQKLQLVCMKLPVEAKNMGTLVDLESASKNRSILHQAREMSCFEDSRDRNSELTGLLTAYPEDEHRRPF